MSDNKPSNLTSSKPQQPKAPRPTPTRESPRPLPAPGHGGKGVGRPSSPSKG